jgi:hypothetical protein
LKVERVVSGDYRCWTRIVEQLYKEVTEEFCCTGEVKVATSRLYDLNQDVI